MIDKALLSKIRKCLALAQSANEHEAALALEKARQLMEEHGIDEATLQMAEVEETTARASRNLRPPKWESILAATVCRALAVSQFVDFQGDRCFVGRGPKSEIAAYAFAVLFKQLKAARSNYIKTHLRRCKPGRKRQRADLYCEGWAAGVFSKIAELLPAPASDEAVEQYLAVQHPGLVSINSRAAKTTRAADDFQRGAVSGLAVDLNVGVGSSARPIAIAS